MLKRMIFFSLVAFTFFFISLILRKIVSHSKFHFILVLCVFLRYYILLHNQPRNNLYKSTVVHLFRTLQAIILFNGGSYPDLRSNPFHYLQFRVLTCTLQREIEETKVALLLVQISHKETCDVALCSLPLGTLDLQWSGFFSQWLF